MCGGFGRLGEQGAETIRTAMQVQFVVETYQSMHDKVQRLICMVKVHSISVAPQNVEVTNQRINNIIVP